MARSLNKVMLIGNLGADPEIKYAASGTPIANFNLATTESRRNRDNEWEENTEWHRIVMFGRLAEVCKDYLRKGSKVYVEGRLQTRSWDDQSGQKRYMTEVVGNNMVMLDGKNDQQAPPQRGYGQSRPQSNNIPEPPNQYSQPDDDLPF